MIVYRMVMQGNFRGVLIVVVHLAVTKLSHPQKLMPTVICESMMMDVATNIIMDSHISQHFLVLACNSSHCHPADI